VDDVAQDQELLYDMITVGPAKIMALPSHCISVGSAAKLVILKDHSLLRRSRTTQNPAA
jgi:cytosine/adenosine deaminase-related metal-dependent hydrolase